LETRVNAQFMKELNEIRILNLIRSTGPISRIEIANRTKISKVAVSEIVSRLDRAGFILEIGKGRSTDRGGKKPTLIKINPQNGYVIGVEIRRQLARVALANLEAEIIASGSVTFPPATGREQTTRLIFWEIDQLLAQNRISPGKLVSICLGVPGFIDYRKGEIMFADTLQGWGQSPLVSLFQKRYNVPVLIENDVNALALGEHLLGAGQGINDLVCLWIGEGVGAGIIVGGTLIRGRNGSAGEIGYLEIGHSLRERGALQELDRGQRYMGDILSEQNLLTALRHKLSALPVPPENLENLSLIQILTDLPKTCRHAVDEILTEYALLIATLCLELIKTLNPDLLILTGKVPEQVPQLLSKVRTVVQKHMSGIPVEATPIAIGKLKGEGCLKGTLAMALQVVFEPLFNGRNVRHLRI